MPERFPEAGPTEATEALLPTGVLQRAILNSATCSTIATDVTGVIRIFNVAAEHLLGYAAAEVVNTVTLADICDPQEGIASAHALSVELQTPITPGVEAVVCKAARGIDDVRELTYIRKDGSRYPTVVTITALRAAEGAVVGYLLIGADKAARTQAEETLRQSQQRVRDIIDGLGPSMFVGLMTPQGIVIEVNRSALAASGLKPEDVVGRPFDDSHWWAHSPDVQRQLREAIARAARGEASRYDVQVRGAANDLIDIDFSLQPLRDETGAVAFLVPSATVITERKRMETALRASNEKFHQLADHITDAFWIRSPDMREVHYISPAIERIWGRSAASLYADPQQWTASILPQDRERVLGVFASLTNDTRSVDLEYRIVRPDGEIRWVRARGFQVRDAADRLIRLTGIATDITERKQAETALRASMEEIVRTNRALKMLSGCRDALVRAEHEQALLDQICRVAVESGGYRMAWVGYAQDDEARSITPMAHAGAEQGYLGEITITWNEDAPLGQGPAGQAIRTGDAVVCEDLTQDSTFAWRAPAQQRGYRGVICLPLRDATRTFGVLALYSAEVHGTSAEELELLQNVADDLVFGIGNLRAQADQVRLQAAVGKSEERYRRIIETANEGISILDTESKLTFVNRRFADMLGYPADELLGRSVFQLVPDGAGAAAATSRIERSRQGMSEEHEVAYVRKDGSELWTLLKTSPIHDTDGTWLGTLGMTTDRTRSRQAEQALRASEEQYRQIVETTTDGIIKVDGDARIVFVNPRFAEMLGYEPGEMIGVSLFAFMDAEAKVVVAQSLKNRMRGHRGAVDATYRHRDGSSISVNVAGSPLVDAEGRHIGSLGVVRDVTEQKKLQSQLMVSDRMASMGTLAAGVAHEINNPLAAVIANLDYIAESLAHAAGSDAPPPGTATSDAWLREEIKGPLDDAREAAHRVRFIVRDLKMFSRSPTDEPGGLVDVQAILESSLRMAWNAIRHRARVVKHYGHKVPGVKGNEARLGQVFLNLLINAAQALPEGRAERHEIRLTTRHDGERVIVEVRDTGSGIPPEIVGRIFDAFFTTKGVGVGTGLGLAICQRIVTDMGGELTVESEVGVGTTFRVALPVAREEDITAAAPAEPAPVAGRRGRILVVDDEELVLRSVERTLAKEHAVVAVGSAKEALALCAAGERFDLVLCDLMMPDMTGMDLHRELARVAPEQANRMIFVTGGTFTDQARQFLSETPREHIEKPFHAANLRAIIQRYLR